MAAATHSDKALFGGSPSRNGFKLMLSSAMTFLHCPRQAASRNVETGGEVRRRNSMTGSAGAAPVAIMRVSPWSPTSTIRTGLWPRSRCHFRRDALIRNRASGSARANAPRAPRLGPTGEGVWTGACGAARLGVPECVGAGGGLVGGVAA